MRPKWYFSILLVALAVFGVCQEQSVAPNQEIVLQLTNKEVTSNHTQEVVAVIKHELESLAAENVQVSEDASGRLTITYFSNEAIATIKSKLASEASKTIGFTSIKSDDNSNDFPSEKKIKYYNFDVFEIQKSSDSHSGFGGKFIVETKQDYDRSSNPNLQPYSLRVDNKYNCYVVKPTLKVNKIIATAVDNTLHNIPEVRAGPIA